MNAAPTRRGADTLRGTMFSNEPMSKHTAWGVGGVAQRLYVPADLDDLSAFLRSASLDEPLLWVGLGSNLLVRDGGLKGTVILTTGLLDELVLVDEETLRASAGIACAKVARFCAKRGLVGGEFLAGIPGTLGGALAMNAGAFGGETWEIVKRVRSVDRCGTFKWRHPDAYVVGYREVKPPAGEWFVAAELGLRRGDTGRAQARIRELLRRRGETQPIGRRSCGSVFRNPHGDYAARLIEASGLKGLRVGGACVSDKHANFILNLGDATAADMEAVIETVRQRVERDHGVRLVSEVHIVGERTREACEEIGK